MITLPMIVQLFIYSQLEFTRKKTSFAKQNVGGELLNDKSDKHEDTVGD